MSEEEKEAIENIKALKILFEIDDKKDFEATPSVQKEMAKDLRTLLNLIEKLLKENEKYRNSDYETICLENNELREITDRIQSEYNDLLKNNFKLKYELETKRKEYQETYKDVREELKELRKENEQLKKQVQRQINKWNKDIKSNYISKHEVKDKNMSEEEKEAIEYLKTRLYGNEGCKYIDVAQEDLRIFINLIDRLQNKKCEPEFDMEKLQKENEQLKK